MHCKNILAIMALSLCFSACSDDDEPVIKGDENEEVVTDALVGDYIGVTKVILKDGYSPKIGQVAKIAKDDDKGEYLLTLPEALPGTKAIDLDSRHGEMPSIVLDDVEFTEEEDGSFTYTDDNEVVGSGDSEVTITDLKVSVKGTALKIEWKAQTKKMAIKITYAFEGDMNEKFVELPSFADAVLGKYKGVNTMKVGDQAMGADTSMVKVFGQNNGKFTFILPESTGEKEGRAMNMPTVEIRDVEFTEAADKSYSFAIEKTEIKAGDMLIKLQNVKASIDANKDMVLTFSLQPGSMPAWIDNSFTTKPEAEKPAVDVTKIAAAYYGDNTMKVGDQVMPGKNQVATIVAQEDGKITLILPEANEEQKARGMEMPSVEVKDIEVAEANGVYTFSLDKISVNTGEMAVELADLKGEVEGNILKLNFRMKPGAMPMWIANEFMGDKTGYKEPEVAVDAFKFEGTYVGDNSYSVGSSKEVLKDFAVKVVAKDNKTVSLHVGNQESKVRGGMALPPFALEDVVLTGKADGSCSFEIASRDVKVGDLTIALSDVKGSISGDKMKVTFNAKPGAMPMTIAFNFEGTKQTAPVNPEVTAAEVLPGKYVGENASSIAGETSKHAALMNVKALENGKFAIQLPEDIIAEGEEKPAMQLPTIFIEDLEAVKGENGAFTVSLDKKVFDVKDGESTKTVTVSGLKATFTEAGKATLVMTVKYGKMPFDLGYDFKGDKEAK